MWYTIPDLVRRWAAETPAAPALIAGGHVRTYAELAARVDRTARALAARGVGTDEVVALALPRSADLVVAMLAAMRAGGAFMPVDPRLPAERIAFMCADTRPRCLLTTAELAPGLPETPGVEHILVGEVVDDFGTDLVEDLAGDAGSPGGLLPSQLAYVIYTSGSTGRPKGVAVTHAGIAEFTEDLLSSAGVEPGGVVALMASPSFDASIIELLLALGSGAALAIAPPELVGGAELSGFFAEHGVNYSIVPPSVLATAPSPGPSELPELRGLLVGGEACPPALVRAWAPGRRMVNAYGPTEATMAVTISRPLVAGHDAPPIGLPVGATRLYVLDGRLNPAEEGELYAGGDALARGYVRRPGLTAERFVADPFAADGSRMYRTGDLVRRLPDGQLAYLGRADDQVKVRGLRIELGEIEATLGAHPAVEQARVVVHEDRHGERRLAAYVVPAEDAASHQEGAGQHVDEWRQIYDEVYTEIDHRGFGSDFSGWNSSYTGDAIPEEQMARWRQAIVDRVLAFGPQRVLEVGVGSGLILSEIAPFAEEYWGTDYSAPAIEGLRAWLPSVPELAAKVRLAAQAADVLDGLPAGHFDTVIINSVIQYFPDEDYLRRVLNQLLGLIRPGGRIFVGDVRNLRLVRAMWTAIRLGQAGDGEDAVTLRREVEQAVALEKELLVDPDFFATLDAAAVDVRIKRGADHNELTRHRYDVVLHKGPVRARRLATLPAVSWDEAVESHDLFAGAPGGFRLTGVPNGRVAGEVAAARAVQEGLLPPVAAIRAAETSGPDPERWPELAARYGYQAAITWSPHDEERLDVVFTRAADAAVDGTYLATSVAGPFTNDPIATRRRGLLVAELRTALGARLPAYMVPAAFTFLDRLPLNTSGKLDRRALPEPDFGGEISGRGPRTPLERTLCEMVTDLLGHSRVGIDDSFFDLGGHSLLATRLINRIRAVLGRDLAVATLFASPTVAGLAQVLAGSGEAGPALSVRERPESLPLSYAQRRVWLLTRLDPLGWTYNLPLVLRLSAAPDVAALTAAFADLVARHESLRTIFPETDGEPRQQILDHADVLTIATHGDPAQAARHTFDLTTDTPLRAWLFPDHTLLIVLHHIAGDGWSMAPLARDLATAYAARLTGHAPDWQPLPVQYADYALWQRELDSTGDVAFWRDTLAGIPDELALPYDRPRPTSSSYQGELLPFAIPAAVHEALLGLARESGATLFMAVHAAVAALFTRLGAGTDIPLGSVVAGRNDEALTDLVGFFVNTLVLRADTSGDPTFRQLLTRVRETDLTAFAHQDLPFDRLVEALNPARSLSRHPLFQTMLVLQNNETIGFDLAGLSVDTRSATSSAAQFDLFFNLTDQPSGGITGELIYRTELFERATAESLVTRLTLILQAAAENPDTPLSRLPVLTGDERRTILGAWNETGRDIAYPTLVRLFDQQLVRTPDAPAVTDGATELSYRDLDRRANLVAHELAALGAGPDTPVAVLLDRSAELVVTVLGVLKAGACYVPLPVDAPPERLRLMIEQAGADILVTDRPGVGGTRHVLPCPAGRRDNAPLVDPRPDHLAYVMFTSGSTGVPKGVALTHRNAAGFVSDEVWTAPQTVLMHSPTGFDASVHELWVPLLRGGRIVIAPPGALTRIDPALGVTRLWLTSGLFSALAEEPANFDGVREVLTGGDVVSAAAVRRVLDGRPWLTIRALYGPTETTTCSTRHPLTDAATVPASVPLGGPMDNTRLYVLDEWLRPVPPGVPGELYIGGNGLARGYLGQPALTAERFVADPYGPPGARLYRTGDLTRRRPDGTLEFIGRTDAQVKVRGYRVEPGEIESALTAHPAVADAHVAVRDERLIGYLVGATDRDVPAVAALAARTLPDYMLPAAYVALDRLPLTPNGKLDRDALPTPAVRTGADTARTPHEEIVANLFADLLGLPAVGAHDDFFALGGHSLLATRLVNRIRAALGRDLGVAAVFESPSPAGLAEALARATADAAPPLVARPRPDDLPLSSAQQRLWFLSRLNGLGWPLVLRLRGPLDTAALTGALTDVVNRHESLRTVFPEIGGEPRQRILPGVTAGDFLTVADVEPDALDEQVAAAAGHQFDLTADTPLKAWLLRQAPDEHVLVLVLHHIAGDGWSMGPLARDLSSAYAARAAERAPDWPPLPVQYADYALWQHDLDTSDHLAFWRDRLSELPEELALPYDRPRPSVSDHRGDLVSFQVPGELHNRLAGLARESGATLFMVMHAAVAALYTRLGAGTDIPLGLAVAGRGDEALDDLVGFFVNSLVLRADTSGDPSFRELLARVREADLGAYAHQDLPFDRLVEALNPARSLARHPLFQTMLVLQNNVRAEFALDGVTAEVDAGAGGGDAIRVGPVDFDLSISMVENHGEDRTPEGITADLRFRTELFDRATVESMADRLLRLLDAVAAEPDLPIGRVEILTPSERDCLTRGWNDTARVTPVGSLPELFAAQARRTPDAVAVHDDDVLLTYAELDRRANALACRLAGEGVGRDEPVAILQRRSAEYVVSVLGVLKAGGVYLPLPHNAPPGRREFMIRQTGARILITDGPDTSGLTVLRPDRASRDLPPDIGIHPDQGAYIMYTSGSTGAPKGILVTQRNVVDFALDSRWRAEPPDRALMHSALAFDASTFDIWTPLLSGGRIVVAPAGDLDTEVLARTIRSGGVTSAVFTAALFHLMVEDAPDALAGLRLVWAAGDVVSVESVARLLRRGSGTQVATAWGTTETTVISSWHPVSEADGRTMPIGTPMDNTRLYVLDRWLRIVPPGVTGELYVGGSGLARGYVAQPGLTAERFVADPYGPPGERLYRTGDLARRLPDGVLDFVGRADGQVKIRGYRVEPGEIETVLTRHPDVAHAAVVPREDRPGDRRLVAYLVPADGTADVPAVRAHAALSLPDYMVPAAFVTLDRLPLTANGKVDRRALPAPQTQIGTTAPRTPQEEALCRLFADVLSLPQVGPDDNFFDLGGHSLLATRLVNRVRAALDVDLTVVALFEAPTAASLAARLTAPPDSAPARPKLRPRALAAREGR
ncbi:non-ribosomal peptide synthetase [Acrocarpospora catenulata]|uniref:non-ribosomal peptide synthetase n=1 Tax=Acrocarpospora catenulata TaxID=2836182 RepID=UPI001BDB48C0|nr:non-ribosomal peptide synthetase [Acrocarpospora catenulata]